MASSEAPPASRVTSSVNITIGAPSFYNTPKKFAPVVAPKPRVNPYKATGTPPSVSSSHRAQLGRVGETPAPAEDLPPPPPPPPPPPAVDDQPLTSPGDSTPPPPPPPFEDSFPPPPGDMTFPSPPPPLEEEGPLVEGPRETEAVDLSPGIHSQIEALTSMLNEMEGNDPYKARVPPSEATTNGHSAKPPDPGAAATAQPWGLPGPRGRGFSPIRAPKPSPKPTFPGGRGRGELTSGPVPGPGSGSRALAPSVPDPIPEISPSPGSRIIAREKGEQPGTGNREERGSGRGSRPGPEEGAPLSYQDVQELESLATELLREMDKHPKAAGRPKEFCAHCQKELSRSEAVVKAMQKLFHIECFVCSSCGRELQGQQFYEVDGQPLCEGCYQNTLEKCAACQQPITEKMLRATGKAFHPQCFTCTECREPLEGKPFIADTEGKVYCVDDYHRRFAPRCSVCDEPIIPEEGKEETVRILALGRNFHVRCYRCEDCSKQLSSEATEDGCYPLDDHILCLQCHQSRVNKGLRK